MPTDHRSKASKHPGAARAGAALTVSGVLAAVLAGCGGGGAQKLPTGLPTTTTLTATSGARTTSAPSSTTSAPSPTTSAPSSPTSSTFPTSSTSPTSGLSTGTTGLSTGTTGLSTGTTGTTAPGSTARPGATTTVGPASATTSQATVPSASALPYSWQRDPSINLQLGGGTSSTLAALVQPGERGQWLIAGTQFGTGGLAQATIWSSPDALNWSKAVLPDPNGSGPDEADAVTNWGQREVVVGSAGSGAYQRAAVWMSRAPGQPFVAIADSPVFGPPSSVASGTSAPSVPVASPVMDTVAAGALGLFAAGTVDGAAAVWYSTNGLQWDALTGADEVIDGEPGAVVNDILSTPGGVFAAGSTVNGNRLAAALWYSSDGIHWGTVRSPGPIFFGAGDHVITSLVDIGAIGSPVGGGPATSGLLAVGGIRVGPTWQPASWISPDGFSWSQTSESFPLDGEPAQSAGRSPIRPPGPTASCTRPAAAPVASGFGSPPTAWRGRPWRSRPQPPAIPAGIWD